MLSFSGFVVSFMMRMDINIAMVSMVNYQSTNISNNDITMTTICYSKSNTSSQILEDNEFKVLKISFLIFNIISIKFKYKICKQDLSSFFECVS
jgi:hypothetical protein